MVVIATFFIYFTFQTCEIVMEKGIESHGKVMKSHGISLRHSCGNPGFFHLCSMKYLYKNVSFNGESFYILFL